MRLAMVVGLLVLAVIATRILADPRGSGARDTARHTESDHERSSRSSAPFSGHKTPAVVPRSDPAVENYWSDRCVEERRFGMTHSRDCDNPAYTGGGGYPVYVAPYPRYSPYGEYGYGTYVPHRGGVDHRRLWDSKTYRDWDERHGRPR